MWNGPFAVEPVFAVEWALDVEQIFAVEWALDQPLGACFLKKCFSP